MDKLNIEIKASCVAPDSLRELLLAANARVIGTDHQTDSYFNVSKGRLKLRQGNIENHLIHYQRANQEGPKASEVSLYKPAEAADLYKTLERALGLLVKVDKEREIYFIDNVKFHIDKVAELGSFVEIEAISCEAKPDAASLEAQCRHYMQYLKIEEEALISHSYSDMLLSQG